MLIRIFLVLLCYLIGSIPFGYLLVKHVFTRGEDIRDIGSGGTGATNVARRAGRTAGVITYLLDFLKGALAVAVMHAAVGDDLTWIGAGAVAAIIGHGFPIFLGFRGGKGVATSAGVFFVLAPYSVIAALVIWAVVVYFSRYVSLGSIIAAASVPVLTFLIYAIILARAQARALVVIAVACFAFITFKHRENIARLIHGTENRIGQRIRPTDETEPHDNGTTVRGEAK